MALCQLYSPGSTAAGALLPGGGGSASGAGAIARRLALPDPLPLLPEPPAARSPSAITAAPSRLVRAAVARLPLGGTLAAAAPAAAAASGPKPASLIGVG
eukprot:5371535-Prymnesium_polylepis.1